MEQGVLGFDAELARLEQELAEGRTPGRTRMRLAKVRRDRERALLGRVAKVLDGYELRGDALVQAMVRRCPALLECADDPLWRTVEALEFRGEPRGFLLGAFLNAMPALRSLVCTALPEVAVPHVETLTLSCFGPRLGECFPGVRRLHVNRVEDARAFWDFVRARGLERVQVGSLTWEGDRLRAASSWIDSGMLEVVWLGPQVRQLVIPEDHVFGDDSGWRLGQLFARVRAMGGDVVLEASERTRRWDG
ncbi:MAG: hypothetical protein ACOZQL_25870 [Myxococcota bacterium]